MSVFKERQASAKKVVQLQNEIISLKQQLTSCKSNTKQAACTKCPELEAELELLQKDSDQKIEDLNRLLTQLAEEASDLKADLKKVRSENTRLKNKLKDLDQDV